MFFVLLLHACHEVFQALLRCDAGSCGAEQIDLLLLVASQRPTLTLGELGFPWISLGQLTILSN